MLPKNIKTLIINIRNLNLPAFSRSFSRNNALCQTSAKPVLNQTFSIRKIGPLVSTFGLGTWQVQRKKWKEDLIAKLQALTNSDSIPLPQDLDEVQDLEYRPVYVKGHFLHDKELYLGPRTLLAHGDAATKSQLMSAAGGRSQGFLVITPFKLADRDETILINRGWVSNKHKNPATRENGQVKGDVNVVGIVRLQENRPQFTPKNQKENNMWFYRDLEEMARIRGTAPVFLDATNDFDIEGGPIGGQTRIALRNEHFSYILTWYSLCGATSFMWYRHFMKRIK